MDITLDNTYDITTANGDFATADNLKQQQALLLATAKGDWKESPLVGVGLVNYMNGENPELMVSEIKRQFKADKLKVNSIQFINSQLYIDAERS